MNQRLKQFATVIGSHFFAGFTVAVLSIAVAQAIPFQRIIVSIATVIAGEHGNCFGHPPGSRQAPCVPINPTNK